MAQDEIEALTVVLTQCFLGGYVMLLVDFRQPQWKWRLCWLLPVAAVVAANVVLILTRGYWGVYTRLGVLTVTLPYALLTLWCSCHRGLRVFFNLATALFVGAIGVVNASLARVLAPELSLLPLLVRATSFLLLFLLLRQFRQMYQQMLRLLDRGWALLCLIPTVTALLVIMVSNRFLLQAPLPTLVLLYGLLVICGCAYGLMFLFFHTILQESQARHSHRLLELQVSALQGRIDAVRAVEEATRVERHDLRHRLRTVAGLVARGKAQEALDFLGAAQKRLDEHATFRWCRPPILDAVFSSYFDQAQRQAIQIEADLRLPEQLTVDESELAIVFANALENAILACEALPPEKRVIRCKVLHHPRLMFVLSNPCAGPVDFDEQGLPLSPRRGQGLGSQSIAAFCQKYGALCRYELRDGWFFLRVIF